MKPQKYPRLTPLKAFELLRKLDQGASNADLSTHQQYRHLLSDTRDALASHVKAAIVKGSK